VALRPSCTSEGSACLPGCWALTCGLHSFHSPSIHSFHRQNGECCPAVLARACSLAVGAQVLKTWLFPVFRLTEATLPASRVAPSVVVSFSPRLRPRRAGACPFALGVARLPGFAFRLIRPVPLGSCGLFRPQRRSPPRHFCSFCSLNMARFTPYLRVHVHRCRCAGGDSAVDFRSS